MIIMDEKLKKKFIQDYLECQRLLKTVKIGPIKKRASSKTIKKIEII